MAGIRKTIESQLSSFGKLTYTHRFKTLIIMAGIIFSMVFGISKVQLDTSVEAFLHRDDPILMKYNAFRDQFGRDEKIIIAVSAPNIFDLTFLKKLEELHQALEENVPYLEDVTSLINARNTRGDADRLIVEDLLENWPAGDKEMADLKQRVLSNPLYRNLLISEDATFTAVVIETSSYSSEESDTDVLDGFEDTDDDSTDFNDTAPRKYLSDAENSEVANAVRKVALQFDKPDFKISIAGSPIIVHDLKVFMLQDLKLFVLLVVITTSIFMFILFRRISGVLLPIIIVLLSLLSTIGLMGHFDVSMKLPTNVLPTFLLAVGVGDAVHILVIFFRRMAFGDDKKEAIAFAMGHSGLAIIMTSLTTAGGLLSFSAAEIAPIAELGIFGGMGIMLAMFYTLVLLPPILSLTPVKVKKRSVDQKATLFLDRFLAGFGDVSTNHPSTVLIISALIIATGLFCALQNRFTHDPMTWLPPETPIRKSTELIDTSMKGSMTLEVVVDTRKKNGLYNPEVLNRMDILKKDIEAYRSGDIFVGKAMHIGDLLKEIHQALNENQPEFYAIPRDPAVIPQEFLLFENSGSDDLEDFVDTQFREARFTIKLPWLDAIPYAVFIETIEQKFQKTFGGTADITVTGLIAILGRTLSASVHSMAKSYFIAFIVITCLMILLIGNFKIGLISMIPNLSPIIIALGVIGVTDIQLDLFTMMTGSIAIGLAVDDTIHFMHNFRRYHLDTGDVKLAVHQTLQSTGRAMLFTTLVLSTGFFIMTFSQMNNLKSFGFITGITILMALLADFLLAPALMAVIFKNKR